MAHIEVQDASHVAKPGTNLAAKLAPSPSCRSRNVTVYKTLRPVRYAKCRACNANYKFTLVLSVHLIDLGNHITGPCCASA